MRKLITSILFIATSSLCFSAANDMVYMQRNPTDTGNLTRITANPPSNALAYFDTGIVRLQYSILGSGITITSGTINVGVTPSIQTALDTKQAEITAGTTSQYYRGDKTWQSWINADWNASSGGAQILNKPSLSTVATSGDYNDLSNKPTIPSAQVNSDWNAVSGVSQILNKPVLGTAASQNSSAFATAAEGALAASALQPTGNGSGLTGITQSQVSGLTAALAGKFNTPAGTTAQYVRGDGSLATLPSPGTGTVTSIGITSTDLSVSGSPITTSGNITVNLPNVGTSGTYSSVTTDAKGRVTGGTNRSFSYSARTLNSAFQISSTRDALVSYAVDISATLTLTGGATGTVILEIATDSGFTTGVQTVNSSANGNTGALTIGLSLTQVATATVTGVIPAGSYVRLRTANTSGTPSFTFRTSQETLL